MKDSNKPRLRSEIWFNDPKEPGETAVYVERFSNYGITREELQSTRPIIGIAQSGKSRRKRPGRTARRAVPAGQERRRRKNLLPRSRPAAATPAAKPAARNQRGDSFDALRGEAHGFQRREEDRAQRHIIRLVLKSFVEFWRTFRA